MQRAFDKLDQHENRTQWKWTAGIVATFGVIMFALVALTWTPAVTGWISDAAQAEFAGTMAPEPAPLQTAQPAREFHAVRAN
jgi:hypothetical protein